MGQKLDENLRKAVTELISGTFYIPQHCACCAGTGNLSDHPLEHSSSSSYTNGNTVTTTTTTNSSPPMMAINPPRPIRPMPATSAVLRSTCSAPATLR